MIFEVLNEAVERGELLLVEGSLCHFHRRRDGTVTIRELLVLPSYRGRGLGRQLVERARNNSQHLVAVCPADLASNGFWAHLGFRQTATRTRGSGRAVNVWEWRQVW